MRLMTQAEDYGELRCVRSPEMTLMSLFSYLFD